MKNRKKRENDLFIADGLIWKATGKATQDSIQLIIVPSGHKVAHREKYLGLGDMGAPNISAFLCNLCTNVGICPFFAPTDALFSWYKLNANFASGKVKRPSTRL